MVHISLPRSLHNLGKSKDQASSSSTNNNNNNNNGGQRPEPPRNGSSNYSLTSSDSKPLILKVYVVKVNEAIGHPSISLVNHMYRQETWQPKIDLAPLTPTLLSPSVIPNSQHLL